MRAGCLVGENHVFGVSDAGGDPLPAANGMEAGPASLHRQGRRGPQPRPVPCSPLTLVDLARRGEPRLRRPYVLVALSMTAATFGGATNTGDRPARRRHVAAPPRHLGRRGRRGDPSGRVDAAAASVMGPGPTQEQHAAAMPISRSRRRPRLPAAPWSRSDTWVWGARHAHERRPSGRDHGRR